MAQAITKANIVDSWFRGGGGNEEEGDERQLDGIVTFRARQGKMQIVKHATQLKAAPK